MERACARRPEHDTDPAARAPGPAPSRGWRVRADDSRGRNDGAEAPGSSGRCCPFRQLALPMDMLRKAAGRATRSGAGSPKRQRPGPTRREEPRPAPAMLFRSVSRGAAGARAAPNLAIPLRHSYSTVRHSMPAASRRPICAAGRRNGRRRRASAAGGWAGAQRCAGDRCKGRRAAFAAWAEPVQDGPALARCARHSCQYSPISRRNCPSLSTFSAAD